MSNSLVEMFSCHLFQRLLAVPEKISDPSLDELYSLGLSTDVDNDELPLSIIGPLLWSSMFINDKPSSNSSLDDEDVSGNIAEIELSEAETKVTTESDVVGTKDDDADSNMRRKRKPMPIRMTASQVCQELSKTNVNPHLLIAPLLYGENLGAAPTESQPFEVRVHPQVRSHIFKSIYTLEYYLLSSNFICFCFTF